MAYYGCAVYRKSDGVIVGSMAGGSISDQASIDALVASNPSWGEGYAGYGTLIDQTIPTAEKYYIPNGVLTALLENGIYLEIDDVVINLLDYGISSSTGYPYMKVPLRLGQHVKIKDIPAGVTYVRKGVTYTTTALKAVSWIVAKTGNDFKALAIPYKLWQVYFEFVPE